MPEVPSPSEPPRGRSPYRRWRRLVGTQAGVAVRHARRAVVFVIGMTIVAIGVVMIVTPGPAMVVIPLGLGVLAVEFAWARRFLERIKLQARSVLGANSEDNRTDGRRAK
ncbi:MAG: PGPGW domain-containing protein [Pirellulales bacterium]|nr:PGPGW domain-containing protein [Pirellulales bacterium]